MSSRFHVLDLWNELYGNNSEIIDYAGRKMLKSAIGVQGHQFEPTIDHIRPIDNGGNDSKNNIIICNRVTNQEKDYYWPHWKTNGKTFKGQKMPGGGYKIVKCN